MTKANKLKVIKKLEEGKARIEQKWIAGSFHRNGGVCALGSLGMRGFNTRDEIKEAATCFLYEALPAQYRREDPGSVKGEFVAGFNDATSQQQVIALFDRAITNAKAAL